MAPHYRDWNYKGSAAIPLAATKLFAARTRLCRLSPLVLMTDPTRTDDPVEAATAMPVGCAIIYRHFGKPGRHEEAVHLRRVTFERGQQFLIGQDPELAIAVGADGVHFRRDSALNLTSLWRARIPAWLITQAGQKSDTVFKQPVSALDALLISSIFDSESPSAGTAIGTEKLTGICEKLDVPVIALGGINAANAQHIIGTGAAGLAGISFS